jgi:hypothetical protein
MLPPLLTNTLHLPLVSVHLNVPPARSTVLFTNTRLEHAAPEHVTVPLMLAVSAIILLEHAAPEHVTVPLMLTVGITIFS